jgi:hypothetical protein
VIVALALTYPVVLHPRSSIPIAHQIPGWAPGDGDPWQSLWAFWLVRHSLVDAHRLPLYTDLIFYPLGVELWYVVLILPPAAVALGLQALVGLVATYNILIVGALALAAHAAFLLVRHVSGHRLGAFLGGLVFAFSPYQLAHALEHVFLIASAVWVPLYALFFIRVVEARRARHVGLATVFLILSAMTSPYYAIALVLFTAIVVGTRMAAAWWGGRRTEVGREMAGMLPVALVVVPGLGWWLARPAASDTTIAPSLAEVNQFSADVLGFFVPSPLHPVWGTFTAPIYARFSGNLFEQTVYLGYVVLALAVLAFVGRRRQALPWVTTAAVFAVLALGPLLHVGGKWVFDIGGLPVTFPLPGLVLHVLPVVNALRALSRFTVMVMLALAVLAGLGVAVLLDGAVRSPSRSALKAGAGVLLGLAILFEYLCAPIPVLPTKISPVLAAMGEEPTPRGSLLDVPLDLRIAKYQYFQTAHRRPLIIGHISRPAQALAGQTEGLPFFPLFQSPDRQGAELPTAWNRLAALRLIDLLDLDAIVLHGHYLGAAAVARVKAVVMEHFPVERVVEDEGLTVLRLRRDHDPLATWSPDAYRFDFGPGEPRAFLAKGWWPPERAGAVGMAWSMGRESTLAFFLPRPWAMTMELRLMPFDIPAAPPQQLTVAVNARALGQIQFPRGTVWRSYSLAIPASAVKPGVNTLRFTYAHTLVPGTALPGYVDPRELAVAFSAIVLHRQP